MSKKKVRPAYLMSLDEYQSEVVPLLVELKAILRKRFFLTIDNYSFEFFTRDGVIGLVSELPFSYQQNTALAHLDKKNIKDTPAPHEMLERFSVLLGMISSYFDERDHNGIMDGLTTSNKRLVRNALERQYLTDIVNSELTLDQVQKICGSHGINVPKRLLDCVSYDESHQSRNLPPLSQAFYDKLQVEIEPFRSHLSQFRKDQIDILLEEFPTKFGDKFDDDLIEKIINKTKGDLDNLMVLSRIAEKGYLETVKLECMKHIDRMLSKFTYRIEDKLRNVNSKQNVVDISFRNTTFDAGIIETIICFTYDNGENITCESSLIIAGGDVQCLHYRYLTNFSHKGKKLSQHQMDLLFA